MRLSAFAAGVLVSTCLFTVNAEKASAQTLSLATLVSSSETADKLAVLELVEEQATPEPVAPPEPPKHVVTEGETLSVIATKHQTTWPRIYAKNAQVENPDLVNPGVELVIPLPEEQLPERPVPVVEVPEPVAPAPAPQQRKAATPKAAPAPAPASRGTVAGNTYTAGYCTWYVKNRRPDLPNNLGNAYTWVERAAAQGIPTGTTPRAGAVGQAGNHVVYVESVNGDGTVTISEMNYQALYTVTTRTVAANYFRYIY